MRPKIKKMTLLSEIYKCDYLTVIHFQMSVTINEILAENLRPHGTITPRLCALPKIHKQGIPVRQILDMF